MEVKMAKRKKKMTKRTKAGTSQKRISVKTKHKNLACLICHSTVSVDKDTSAIVCGRCVARVSGSPEAIGKVAKPIKRPELDEKGHKIKSKRKGNPNVKKGNKCVKIKGAPRGWWFKKLYVHTDGKKYSFGQPLKKAKK